MDILNDVLYLLNKKYQDVAYKVPLSCIVDYKGFRCLVLSTPPVNNEDTLIQGPLLSEGTFRVNKNVEEDLLYICGALNLKDHKFVLDDKVASIHVFLSIFTEIHKCLFVGYEDEKNLSKIIKEDTGEGKRTFSEKKNPDCLYIMKTGDILPLDMDIHAKGPVSFIKRLR